jgi:hypothetical protein
LTAAFLLMFPLLGSYFISDWHWHPGAFVVLGVILFGIGFAYQLVTRNHDALAYRVAVVLAMATGFLLTWSSFVQMADVTPLAALNFGVPLVGLIGAAVARLRPKGMGYALFATAFAQLTVLSVVGILLLTQESQPTAGIPPEVRGLAGNVICVLLFTASALLFRKAAHEESASGIV